MQELVTHPIKNRACPAPARHVRGESIKSLLIQLKTKLVLLLRHVRGESIKKFNHNSY